MPSDSYRHPDPAPTNLDQRAERGDLAGALRKISEWAETVVASATGVLRQHADSHRPDSTYDPLPTDAPSVDVGADTPEEGTAGTLLRSDAKLRLGIGQNKGDILVFDGSQWQRLPVGANTKVLTAASAEATGVKWDVGGGGGGSSDDAMAFAYFMGS